MPFLPLASLVSTLASNVVQIAAHVADADSAKGSSSKPPGKEKKHSDAGSLANTFAACLAAAAAAAPTVPLTGTSNTGSKTQKDEEKSIKGVSVVGMPLALVSGSIPKTATTAPPIPGAKNIAAAANANANAKPATPAPTPPLAAAQTVPTISGARPATLGSAHAARASTPATPPVPLTTTASTPTMNPEGKGEIHLGSHTLVETPAPEIATSVHPQSAANPSVSALSDPSPSGSSRTSGTSTAAVSGGLPAHATQGADNVHYLSEETQSSLERAQELGSQRGVSALGSEGTRMASLTRMLQSSGVNSASNATPTLAANTPAPPHHGDSRTHDDANSSSSAPVLTDNGIAPPPIAGPPSPNAAPMPSPVADQLTQAFLAHADVVQQAGRTDFHLRLDPPQLGSVQIHLTATDHSVSARIVVAQEGTRQLLQDQSQHLRQGLAQAGLSLGSFDVTRDGGGSRGGGQQPPPQTPLSLPTPVSTPRSAPAVPAYVQRASNGIDLLA